MVLAESNSFRQEQNRVINLDKPIHSSEILRAVFLEPLDFKPYSLVKKLHVPCIRLERLASEATPVTPETALRLAKFFGTMPQF